MRLQSAIFSIEDTLPGQEGADKVLSILKMEGVWLYGVTALPRAEAEALLSRCGAAEYFRGLLTAEETGRGPLDLLERAMRRLRSEKRDTVVFTGSPELLRRAVAEGWRTVAVKGFAPEADWPQMAALAEQSIERYGEFLR